MNKVIFILRTKLILAETKKASDREKTGLFKSLREKVNERMSRRLAPFGRIFTGVYPLECKKKANYMDVVNGFFAGVYALECKKKA